MIKNQSSSRLADGCTGPSGARVTLTDVELDDDGAAINVAADLKTRRARLVFVDQGRGFDDGGMLDEDAGDYSDVVAALAGDDAAPEDPARVRWELEMLACRAIDAAGVTA